MAKYSELVEEIEDRDFVVDLITLEVGSRGFVGYDGFCQLRDSVGASQKELNDLLLAVSSLMSSIAIECLTEQWES